MRRRPSSWWVLLYAWSLVGLVVACLVLANALVRDPTRLLWWAWLAVMATYGAVVWLHIRQRDHWVQYGRLDEQTYVLASLAEASQRGMPPSDWLELYWERCAAELVSPTRGA